MSPEEKSRLKELYPRMVEGWRMAELDQLRRLRNLDFGQGYDVLSEVFEMGFRLPARGNSGASSIRLALEESCRKAPLSGS